MATEFTFFPRLPLELRRYVWELAVPRHRVLELDAPCAPLLASCCDMRFTTRRNAQPPAIARVCHEARQVAMREGSFLKDLKLGDVDPDAAPRLDIFNKLSNPWFYPHGDIVHLNWQPEYSEASSLDETSPIPYIKQLARNAKCDVSIMADVLVPFPDDPCRLKKTGEPTMPQGFRETFRALESLDRCLVCLMTVSIHCTPEQVASSGLFEGGASPVQLVNADDHNTIGRMSQLAKSGPSEDTQPRAQLEMLINRETFHESLALWRDQIAEAWVWQKFETHCESKNLSTLFNQLVPQWVQMNRRGFNASHPWVRANMSSMPKFEPVILFRHCSRSCFESLPASSSPTHHMHLQSPPPLVPGFADIA